MKKVLSILLATVMLLGTVNFTASAEDTDVYAIGTGKAYETWSSAVSAAADDNSDGAITYHIYGKVNIDRTGWVSPRGSSGATTINFVGMTDDAEICIPTATATIIATDGVTDMESINYTNLILSRPEGAWVGDLAHANMYFTTWMRGATDGIVTYTDCTFPNGTCSNMYNETVYTDCTFNNPTEYALWIMGGETIVTNGNFEAKKGVKTYNDNPNTQIAAEISNCTFDIESKPAVVASALGTVVLEDIDATACEYGILENGSTKGAAIVTIDGQTPEYVASYTNKYGIPVYTTSMEHANAEQEDAQSEIGTPAAIVGSVPYATLEDALTAAQDGDTVTVYPGTYEGGFSVGKNITLQGTLDENGNPLTIFSGDNGGSYYAYSIYMNKGTIKDIKIIDAWKGIMTEGTGDLTLDNVTIVEAGYGIHIAEAKSASDTVLIQNSNIDVTWANSFAGGAYELIFRNNVLTSNNPYYTDGSGSPVINTFVPKTTVEENIFGENAKLLVRPAAIASGDEGIIIGTNFYEDGAENVIYEDGVTISIPTYYETADKTTIGYAPITIGTKSFYSISDALAVATDGDIITVAPGTYNAFNAGVYTSPLNNITIKAVDPANKPVINVSEVNDGGIEYQGSNITFENLKFVVTEDCAAATTWNVSVLGYYYENVGISREGLTVKGCEFINNSDIEMSAIAANLSTYTVENCIFTNFLTGVHSYMDNSVVENVSINNNNYSNVDTLVSVYYGGAANGTSTLTVRNNKSLDESVTKLSVDDYAKVNNTTTKAYDVLNVNNNDANVIVHNYKNNEYSTDLSNNTNVVYNYASKDIALACAETGDEFYFNYGRNTQTKAKKTADGIIYTEISANSGKAVFLDGVYYNTIAEATVSAANNDVIVILADGVSLEDADASTLAGKSVTIDLNEKVLTINSATDYSDLISIPKNYKVDRTAVTDSVYTYSLKKVVIASPVGVVGGSGSSVSKPSTPSQNKTDEETKEDTKLDEDAKTDESDANKEDSTTSNTEKTTNNIVLTIGDANINVFGNTIKNDVAPKLVNDRTMLPARLIAESLGATVTWTAAEPNKVLIEKGDKVIIITIGSDIATVNGEEIKLDSPAFIENDRTYIPTRFLSEKLGATVEWVPDTTQVIITVTE